MKLKKGDKIRIIKGKDRGKEGEIEKIMPVEARVLAAGLNVYKKHVKPKKQGDKGGVIELSVPISMANVALICPKCKKQTRVGYKITDKEKVRICRKCKERI